MKTHSWFPLLLGTFLCGSPRTNKADNNKLIVLHLLSTTTCVPVLVVPRCSIQPAEVSVHLLYLAGNPGILEITSIFPYLAPLYYHLRSAPGWPVLDHLRQELVLSRAVDAGQICTVLLATDIPAGCHVIFVRHQKVAVILELRPGLGADH